MSGIPEHIWRKVDQVISYEGSSTLDWAKYADRLRLALAERLVAEESRLDEDFVNRYKSQIKGFLAKAEAEAIQRLVEAWEAFRLLPVEHADDTEEFRRAIHAAQKIIFARPARRLFNDSCS